MDPLLPSGFDALFVAVFVIGMLLAATAPVSIAVSGKRLANAAVALWVIAVLLFPVLGALAWFVAGPTRRGAIRDHGPASRPFAHSERYNI